MKSCVGCGAAALLLYFAGGPLCLNCDHVGEEATPTQKKPPGREQSLVADATPVRSEQRSRTTSLV
jgi:hypothetical protein